MAPGKDENFMSSTRQPRYHESGSPYYLHTHRRLALRFYRLSFRKMRWTSWRAWIFRHARSPQCKSPNESNLTCGDIQSEQEEFRDRQQSRKRLARVVTDE